jgi:hypothetical protein
MLQKKDFIKSCRNIQKIGPIACSFLDGRMYLLHEVFSFLNAEGDACMDRLVWGMGFTRALYALLNLGAALLIWKFADVAHAMKINAFFGSLMGPMVFLLVSGLGMAGLAKALSPVKIVLIVVGLAFIMIGVRK